MGSKQGTVKMLTPAAAALAYNIPLEALEEAMRTGACKAADLGGQLRVWPRDLEKWIEKNAEGGDRLLAILDVMSMFNVPDKAVRAALNSGELKGRDFGGRAGWRMKEENVRAWIASFSEKGNQRPVARGGTKAKAAAKAARRAALSSRRRA